MSVILREKTLPLRSWTDRWPGGAYWKKKEASSDEGDPPWDGETVAVVADPPPAHVGLWMDRALCEPESCRMQESDGDSADGEGHKGRDALQRSAIRALRLDSDVSPALEMYRRRYEYWHRRAIEAPPAVVRRIVTLKAVSRVLLHPASSSTVTEGGMLFHHTYGVPYIPGSALKGICRARARRLAAARPDAFRLDGALDAAALRRADGPAFVNKLFGFTPEGEEGGEAGFFDFWDALWIPERKYTQKEEGFSPLARDIVNPHHAGYYTEAKGADADASSLPSPADAPVPTHFLSLRPGALFLVVVEAYKYPDIDKWLDCIVRELLLPGLRLDGVGAKTSSGYGRLEPVDPHWDESSSLPSPEDSSSPSSAVSPEREELAYLAYHPGSSRLTAMLVGKRIRAEAVGAEARELWQGLPDPVKKRIKRGKEVRMKVRYSKFGNRYRLDEIIMDQI